MTGYMITVTPQGRGRFLARHGEKVLHHSTTQPLLDCARTLLEQGAKSKDRIWITHDGSTISLGSTIGKAAKLTVLESDKTGPVFVPYRPFDVERVAERVAATAVSRAARGEGGGLARKRL